MGIWEIFSQNGGGNFSLPKWEFPAALLPILFGILYSFLLHHAHKTKHGSACLSVQY